VGGCSHTSCSWSPWLHMCAGAAAPQLYFESPCSRRLQLFRLQGGGDQAQLLSAGATTPAIADINTGALHHYPGISCCLCLLPQRSRPFSACFIFFQHEPTQGAMRSLAPFISLNQSHSGKQWWCFPCSHSSGPGLLGSEALPRMPVWGTTWPLRVGA
jgi:hypothetical protein